VQYYEVKVGG
jgi:cell division protein ZapA (FtsZ GTPase activity inhibitor)